MAVDTLTRPETDADVIAEILRWVNDERVGMYMPPIERLPKGVPGHPTRCTLARALGDDGEEDSACITDTFWMRSLGECGNNPAFVRAFIHDFDHGAYPELVA